MKKRILAIAMALIMLTGTSPLTVDASEIFDKPTTEVEALTDAPVEETEVAKAQAAAAKVVEPEEAPAADENANTETTTPDPKPAPIPASEEDKPTDAPAPKEEQSSESAPAQDEPEEDIEKEVSATPSDVQKEPEEQVGDVVEIKEEETPLAGPITNTLSLDNAPVAYAEDGRERVFVVNEGSIEKFGGTVTNSSEATKEEYNIYVVPGDEGEGLKITRKNENGFGSRGVWWAWAKKKDGINARGLASGGAGLITKERDIQEATQESDRSWVGGINDGCYTATINVGGSDELIGTSATLKVVRAERGETSGGLTNLHSIKRLAGECDIIIHVVKWVDIKYMKNGTEEYSLAELGYTDTDGLGVTYGYYTPEKGIESQAINVPKPPQKDGYEFAGWKCEYTDSEGNRQKVTYQPGEESFRIPCAGEMKLYAQWNYKVQYYKDGTLSENDTVTEMGMFGEPVPEALYADERYDGYRLQKIEGSTKIGDDVSEGSLLKVYYVSQAKYTIKYYKDDQFIESAEGMAFVNTEIKKLSQYKEDKYFGYTFIEAKGQEIISGKDEENVLDVYYKKSSGDLIITTDNKDKVSIFKITCSDDPDFSMEVAVTGTLTVKSLPAGKTYVVQEVGGWFWNYSNKNRGVETARVEINTPGKVEFGSLGDKIKYWFGAEAQRPNDFGIVGAVGKQEGGTNE